MPIHIWFILIYLGRYHEQMPSLINHEIFSLNAVELFTLMHIQGTDKFNFRIHFVLLSWLDNVFFSGENSHKTL